MSFLALSAQKQVGVEELWLCVVTAAKVTDKQVVAQREGDQCSDKKLEEECSGRSVFIQKSNLLYSSPKKKSHKAKLCFRG